VATGWTVRGSNPGWGEVLAYPASCTMDAGSFPGVKRPGRGADHTPLLAPRSRKSSSIPLLPSGLSGLLLVDLLLRLTNPDYLIYRILVTCQNTDTHKIGSICITTRSAGNVRARGKNGICPCL
jgi:hypothetical protein